MGSAIWPTQVWSMLCLRMVWCKTAFNYWQTQCIRICMVNYIISGYYTACWRSMVKLHSTVGKHSRVLYDMLTDLSCLAWTAHPSCQITDESDFKCMPRFVFVATDGFFWPSIVTSPGDLWRHGNGGGGGSSIVSSYSWLVLARANWHKGNH